MSDGDQHHNPIYTIGYGARNMEQFIRALQANAVAYLIDVRSRPYSRYKPEFSREALEQHLRAAGIRYVFMGEALGGQPDDPDCYNEDGKVDYDRVREKAFFQSGINRLQEAGRQGLIAAIMCSEGRPENCHRSKLIGRELVNRNMDVRHIDENDQLLTQDQVMDRVTGNQPSLFGEGFHQFTSRKRYEAQDEDPGE